MAKAKPLVAITEDEKKIVIQALGAVAPRPENMSTRDGWRGGPQDVVMYFDTPQAGRAAAAFMFQPPMNIRSGTGAQKAVAQNSGGKYEVLVSQAQMETMKAYVAKNAELLKTPHPMLAAAGEPPISPSPSPKAEAAGVSQRSCNILASKNPVSVAFAFATPQELEAFSNCFPKTVPNYKIEGNSLVITQSKELGSIPVEVSGTGSVTFNFDGSLETIAQNQPHYEQLCSLLPNIFKQNVNKTLFFNPGTTNVPYRLTSQTQTEAFMRDLSFARLDGIAERKDRMKIDATRLPEEKSARESLKLQDDQLQAKRAKISELITGLSQRQREAVESYILTGVSYKQSPEKYLKSNISDDPIKEPILLQELDELHLMSVRAQGLNEAISKIDARQKITTEIDTLDSLLKISGAHEKYQPIHKSMQDNDAKIKKIQEAFVEHKAKTIKLERCINDKSHVMDHLLDAGKESDIINYLIRTKNTPDKEFGAYLKALFDQKQGDLAIKVGYAYEVMDKDLKMLNASGIELRAVQTALDLENQNLRSGIKQTPDPALNDKFAQVVAAVDVAGTTQGVSPVQAPSPQPSPQAAAPDQPRYRLSGDDKRGITMEHTNGIGRKPSANQHAAFLLEAERIIGKGKALDDLKLAITFDANDDVIKIAAANGTRDNPKIGAYAQAVANKDMAISFKTQDISDAQADALSVAFAATTGLSSKTLSGSLRLNGQKIEAKSTSEINREQVATAVAAEATATPAPLTPADIALFQAFNNPDIYEKPYVLLDTIRTQIANGANIHARNAEGNTLLHIVAERPEFFDDNKRQDLGSQLIGLFNKVNPNAKNNFGQTPAHVAATKLNPSAARYLARVPDANPLELDTLGRTPLCAAVAQERGNPVIEVLIMNGKGLDVPDKDGMTPLHHAANKRDAKTIEALLSKGVNINALDSSGRTPLDILQKQKNVGAAIGLNNAATTALKSRGAKFAVELQAGAASPRPPQPLMPPPPPQQTPEEMVRAALGEMQYSTRFQPAYTKNAAGKYVAEPPEGKKDMVLTFDTEAEARTVCKILKGEPYEIGGNGFDGMKVVLPQHQKFAIVLSQDNIKVISEGLKAMTKGLAPEAPHPAKAMRAAFEKQPVRHAAHVNNKGEQSPGVAF